MSTDKEDLEIDDESASQEEFRSEPPAENAKINLSKRRTTDNLLEECRLHKPLADYDFDL